MKKEKREEKEKERGNLKNVIHNTQKNGKVGL